MLEKLSSYSTSQIIISIHYLWVSLYFLCARAVSSLGFMAAVIGILAAYTGSVL